MDEIDYKRPVPYHNLNKGQGSIFTLWECAQSIFRMILGLYRITFRALLGQNYGKTILIPRISRGLYA